MVSVILPAHNCEITIKESINSALIQGKNISEVLIILNGCSDSTPLIVEEIRKKDSRVKVLYSSVGKVPARNLGLRHASSPYVAFLDADDIWHPEKINCQLEYMNNNRIDILGTQIRMVYPDLTHYPRQIKHPENHTAIVDSMLSGINALANSSVIVRSSIFDFAGNYDDCFPFCEDFHLWLKCIKFARFANINKVYVTYRFENKLQYDHRIAVSLSAFYKAIYSHTGVVL